MPGYTVAQLLPMVQPKAFVTLEHKLTGLRLNHFQTVPELKEQFLDPIFLKTFKIIGDILVPTFDSEENNIVLAVFSYKTFMENF